MTNTKLTKIFILIFSLVLLIGSTFAIAVSAEDADGTYEIKAINIAHGDTIKVLIAVDAPMELSDMGGVDPKNMPAPNIEVKYTVGDKTKTATYWYYMNIFGGSTYYPVYYTEGIAIKDCGEDILAEAHASGTRPAEPKYKNASVAEYLYARLYKDGYAFRTEAGTKENDSRNFYVNMLYYIASAQQVLWNDKTQSTSSHKVLVTDRIYTYVEDGYITELGKSGGFIDGSFTSIYTASIPKQIGWYVKTLNGTYIHIGNTLTLTESARLVPYFDTECIDFEDVAIDNGLYTAPNAPDPNDATKYKSSTVTLVGTLGDELSFSYYPTSNELGTGHITTSNAYAKVVLNSGNRYLQYYAPARSTNHLTYTGNASLSGSGRAYSPGIDIAVTDAVENPNVTVFEFDYNVAYAYLQILFSGSGGSSIYPCIKNGTIYGVGGNKNESVTQVSQNAWNKIRYEYYWEEGVTQIYVNGVYRGSSNALYNAHGKPSNIAIGIESNYSASFMIDNIYARNIYKVYEVEPKAYVVYEDFSSNYTPTYYEWTCNNATFKNEVSEGRLPEGITESTAFGATSFSFPSGIKVDHAAGGASTSGYSNVHGSSATVMTDENGNRYLSLLSPTRISGRDRAYSLQIAPQILHPAETKNRIYVFDFDLKLDSTTGTESTNQNSLEIIFYNGERAAQFAQTITSDGDILLNNTLIGARDEWHSLRFEIYSLGDKARIKVLKKDDAGVYKHLSTWVQSNVTSLPISNLSGGVTLAGINPLHPASINLDNVAFYTSVKEYNSPEIAFLYKPEGNEVLPTEKVNALKQLLTSNSEIGIHAKSDADEITTDEIVIGKSSRAITAKAEALIDKAIKDSTISASDLVGYCIYVENGSAAIAWSDFRLYDIAIDTFISDLVKSGQLNLIDGYVKTEVMSLSAYLKARGDKIKEDAWTELEEVLPDE